MDWGQRVLYFPYVMYTMTVYAIGCSFIPGRHPFAMHTGLVKSELIHTLLGPEPVNQNGIAVTVSTKSRHRCSLDFTLEPAGPTHSQFRIILIPVPPVTICTAEASMLVHVRCKGEGWCLQIAFHRSVAFDTRVLGPKNHWRKQPKTDA